MKMLLRLYLRSALILFSSSAAGKETGSSQTINQIQTADSLNLLSRNMTYVNPAKAIALANEALEVSLFSGYKRGTAYAYRNLAGVYSTEESFFIALEYLRTAEQIFASISDSTGLANCYVTYGHTFRRLEKRDLEWENHNKSLEMFKKFGMRERTAVAMHNLGETLLLMDSLPRASELTEQAILILEEEEQPAVLQNALKVRGLIALKENDFDKAETAFLEVLEILTRLGEQSQKAATIETLLHLSDFYEKTGRVADQKKALSRAEAFTQTWNLRKYQVQVFNRMGVFYSNHGSQDELARFYQTFAAMLPGSALTLRAQRQDLLNGVINAHRLEEKNQTLETEAREQTLRVQRLTWALVLFLVVLVALGIVLFSRHNFARVLQKANDKLIEKRLIIEKQNRDLAILNDTKDRFFSIVAHDLRTPLASLKSFSYLLETEFDSLSKEDILNLSRLVSTSVDNTTALADNIITWAMVQMKEAKTTPEIFDPEMILHSVIPVYREIAQKKNIQIFSEFTESFQVTFDKNHWLFIVRNLLSNAIKFTHEGGWVKIKCSPEIWLSVSDSGVGMDAQTLERLFEPGTKFSKTGTAGEKGTGLGLMLVKDFAEMNNAQFILESKPGSGTRVYIIPAGQNRVNLSAT